MAIYVDNTHLGRHVTGLERITLELFSAAALAPLDIVPVTARGTRQMVTTQTLGLPMRLATSSSILLCPGFPPSPLLRPFAARVLPYIHDDFLLTRRADLNARARLYMAAPFKLALRHYPRFLANSSDTSRKLEAHCRSDAEVTLYRPPVRNVFGLQSAARTVRNAKPQPLRLVTLGTVEPRKKLRRGRDRRQRAARARFCRAPHWISSAGRAGATTGGCSKTIPSVTLHGYQPTDTGQGTARCCRSVYLHLARRRPRPAPARGRSMRVCRSLRPTPRSSARCLAFPASISIRPNRCRRRGASPPHCPVPDGARVTPRLRNRIRSAGTPSPPAIATSSLT